MQLASKHAHHFYSNGLKWSILPAETDSGHPPVFGYYIAVLWTTFGKTLPVSHWAMLPFITVNIWLLYKIGKHIAGPVRACWLLPLVLLDPVLAGQQALVSPDVALVSGFLLAVLGVLEKRYWLMAAGVLVLCMLSMRGMMTAAAVFTWHFFQGIRQTQLPGVVTWIRAAAKYFSTAIRSLPPFLPGFIFAAWFLWWHHTHAGWTGYYPGSSWAPAFEKASGLQVWKNIAVVGWRWLDFGRLFEWLMLGGLVFRSGGLIKTWRRSAPAFRSLMLLLLCLILFLCPTAILFQNISAHRYFLPGFIVLHLAFFGLLTAEDRWKTGGRYWIVLLIFGLAGGNLWIYPRGISMGWDATLAHVSYHRLRAEVVKYLEREKIDFRDVGSAFPNLNSGEYLMLNGDQRRFAEKNFARNRYILASNVFNDFSEADYEVLHRQWHLINRYQHAGVWIELYRRSD